MTKDADDQTASRQVMRAQWDAAAAGWDRHTPAIRAWLRQPTDAMLSMAGIAAGQTVLDVAAGAGDQTLDIAARVGPSGAVVATDISETILTHALHNARQAGYATVSAVTADAAELSFKAARFDAAVCRLGLMFLPDPIAGLREIYRVLKPGARFCAMVFAGPEANPCLRILMQTALRYAGLPPRDPFLPGGLVSLGKPGLPDDLFRNTGFRAVATTRMDAPFRMPSTRAYLAFVKDAAGPVLHILGQLEPEVRAAAWADIEAQLDAFQTPQGWSGPNTVFLTTGQK